MSFLSYSNITQMHVELSSQCNAACPNCPRNVHGGYTVPGLVERSMSLDEFTTMFPADFVKQLRHVTFCGNFGDPVMCKDLPDILMYLDEHGIDDLSISVHTNGGIQPETFWRRVAVPMSNPNRKVIWSIDGLESTNHIYRRNVRWNKLLKNINAYIGAGGIAHWEFLRFEHNQHQEEEARALSEQLGFKKFIPKAAFGFIDFNDGSASHMPVINRDGSFDHSIFPPSGENNTKAKEGARTFNYPPSIYAQQLDQVASASSADLIAKTSWADDVLRDASGLDCVSAINNEIYVDSSGYVYPCCFLGMSSQNVNSAPIQQFKQMIEQHCDKSQYNLFYHSLQEIMDSDYFGAIEKTFTCPSHTEGRLMQCTIHCNAKSGILKNLYVEKTQ